MEVNPSQNIITFLAGDDNFARGELVSSEDWMHVAVVFSDTVATIYVNGADVTFDNHINPVSSDDVPLWIGNLTGSEDDPEGGAFNGHIDEIGILDINLKSQKKDIVKQQASGLLEKTDWHNHKALDDDTYTIPANIKTYRANVRAKSNEMETQIDACTTVDELKALYEYTEQEDGTITRPLAEFPKEI